MTMRTTIQGSVLAVAMVIAGCASDGADRVQKASNVEDGPALVTQEEARHLVAEYRRRAADLRMMAERAAWEARWYAGQFGADDQEGIRRQAQAQQLWAAAEEADQMARDYRRQVPHGQMY